MQFPSGYRLALLILILLLAVAGFFKSLEQVKKYNFTKKQTIRRFATWGAITIFVFAVTIFTTVSVQKEDYERVNLKSQISTDMTQSTLLKGRDARKGLENPDGVIYKAVSLDGSKVCYIQNGDIFCNQK